MELPRDAMLLRVFVGEADECQDKPLYEQIVLKARERKTRWGDRSAGADGLRQIEPPSYGKDSSTFHGSADRR
jgi:PII-like signaling protein